MTLYLTSVSAIVHLVVSQTDHQAVAILHWRDLCKRCVIISIVLYIYFVLFTIPTLTLESELMTLSPKAKMVEPFFQMITKSPRMSTWKILVSRNS